VVKSHGLEPPQPIMCHSPDSKSGGCLYMFQSSNKYYFWNPIESTIGEIVTSMDLVNIVTEIGKPRMGSLKFAEVH
jgi:hypothetical protein